MYQKKEASSVAVEKTFNEGAYIPTTLPRKIITQEMIRLGGTNRQSHANILNEKAKPRDIANVNINNCLGRNRGMNKEVKNFKIDDTSITNNQKSSNETKERAIEGNASQENEVEVMKDLDLSSVFLKVISMYLSMRNIMLGLGLQFK